jgi:hypothetical protein
MRKYKRVENYVYKRKRMTLFRNLERLAGKVYQMIA